MKLTKTEPIVCVAHADSQKWQNVRKARLPTVVILSFQCCSLFPQVCFPETHEFIASSLVNREKCEASRKVFAEKLGIRDSESYIGFSGHVAKNQLVIPYTVAEAIGVTVKCYPSNNSQLAQIANGFGSYGKKVRSWGILSDNAECLASYY